MQRIIRVNVSVPQYRKGFDGVADGDETFARVCLGYQTYFAKFRRQQDKPIAPLRNAIARRIDGLEEDVEVTPGGRVEQPPLEVVLRGEVLGEPERPTRSPCPSPIQIPIPIR